VQALLLRKVGFLGVLSYHQSACRSRLCSLLQATSLLAVHPLFTASILNCNCTELCTDLFLQRLAFKSNFSIHICSFVLLSHPFSRNFSDYLFNQHVQTGGRALSPPRCSGLLLGEKQLVSIQPPLD
jgi:hypothetical protein